VTPVADRQPGVAAPRADTVALGVVGVLVVAMPAAASFLSLRSWAADNLALTGWRTAIVPLSLDLVMALFIVASIHATRRGQSAGGSRVLVLAAMLGSAAANADHGATISTQAALYYGAMPIVAGLGFETLVRRIRHSALARLGVVEGPAPHYRPSRWAIDFRGTWAAWAVGITEGISDPRQAIERSRLRRSGAVHPGAELTREQLEVEAAALAGLAKRDQCRRAVEALSRDTTARAVVDWVRERGGDVSQSHAQAIIHEVRAERPLHAVEAITGNGADSGEAP